MVKYKDLHWVNHHIEGGHRKESEIIQGFNTVVDIDGTTPLTLAPRVAERLYLFNLYY